MKIILTMLVLNFATQISAGSSCHSNQNDDQNSTLLGGNDHGTWKQAASGQ